MALKFISLATKNAIVYFLLTMAGLTTLGYLLFRNSAEEIIHSSEQQVSHAGEIVEIKFTSFVHNIQRDIRHLAGSPFLADYLQSIGTPIEPTKKKLLADEYLALLLSKPDYAQIRLIGTRNEGKELIRAERLNHKIFLVGEDSLQQKGDRNYFYETAALHPDSVYFSPIDLNRDFGQISFPAVPTIRAASPIYRNGQLFGIVIINVNLHNVFQELKKLAGPRLHLKIFNQDGHFLIHPDQEKTFTFEFGKPPLFQDDFGLPIEDAVHSSSSLSLSRVRERGYLYAFRPLFYPKNGYRLFLAVGSDEKEIFRSFYQWRRKSLSITFGLVMIILFLALGYMRRQVKELKDITQTMTSFPLNPAPAKLPISRNDEIGRLAQSFEEMSSLISSNFKALQKAKEEVDQAIKEKDTFLENMSHEIRNPIHSIIGMTHLLEKNNPGRHQKAFIESLKFNSRNLLSLVNDILDYKKLSSGDISIYPEWISLPLFIEEISNSHQFSAVSKKIKLQADIDPSLFRHLVFLDPLRLTQIVNNLVINAIKFTSEKGEVTIKAVAMETKEDQAEVRLSVIDNGSGIEPDKVHRIIERYYTKTGKKDHILPEGAGLGLPIVIQLLQLFHSKLHIESKPGEGSHFYFDLQTPLKQQEPFDPENETWIPAQILDTARVLVIDDDEQVLFLYEHIFEKHVKNLNRISQIQELVNLDGKKYDIILADIHLDKHSILSFTKEIEAISTSKTLLYIVSGIDAGTEPPGGLPGFRKLFHKPVDPETLLSVISYDYACLHFGTPDFNTILNDYDHDEGKFRKAIDMLIDEWEKMSGQIEISIVNSDEEKFTALRHKLITAVRRLRLSSFEEELNRPFLQENEGKDLAYRASRIKKMMTFFIWYLKNKIP